MLLQSIYSIKICMLVYFFITIIREPPRYRMKDTAFKTIAQNKKVFHDYSILEKLEAGIELFGTEVKSLRQGRVNLKDSWCSVNEKTMELMIHRMHVSPYEKGNIFNKDPTRVRKLLMHKSQILRIYGSIKKEGYTVVPVSLYFKGSLVKVQIGMCKGKKLFDKRRAIAEKDTNRRIARNIKEFNR